MAEEPLMHASPADASGSVNDDTVPPDTAGEAGPKADPDLDAQDAPPWWRHDNGRWVVGDAGRQAEIVVAPSTSVAATRPDTIIDGGLVESISYRAASLRGLSHQAAGTPRQDAYLVRPTRDSQWLVGCVADGVSEGRSSHEAADIACREITTMVAASLADIDPGPDDESWQAAAEKLPWQQAVDQASAAIRQAGAAMMQSVYERRGDTEAVARLIAAPLTDAETRRVMSTTAIGFVVSTVPGPDGNYPCAIAIAAGDSSAFLLADGVWQPITAVKNEGAEIASSAVEPLPRATVVRPVAYRLRPGDVLVVVSDGVGDPLGTGRGVVGKFLRDEWTRPPDLLSFAQQVGFYRKTFTDDRTAVVVWTGSR